MKTFALMGILALLVAMTAGATAEGSDAPPAATTAKKKCKKAKKAAVAKKKKKKKKCKKAATKPSKPGPGSLTFGPLIRMTLTWNPDADLDLHIWDAAGREAHSSNIFGIPGGVFKGPGSRLRGPEQFQGDNNFIVPTDYTYGVCFQQPADGDTLPYNIPTWTADFIKGDGAAAHETGSVDGLTGLGRKDLIWIPAGGFNPDTSGVNWCPNLPLP